MYTSDITLIVGRKNTLSLEYKVNDVSIFNLIIILFACPYSGDPRMHYVAVNLEHFSTVSCKFPVQLLYSLNRRTMVNKYIVSLY